MSDGVDILVIDPGVNLDVDTLDGDDIVTGENE